MSKTFYGGSLKQREEHKGPSVPFAGHTVFGLGRALRVRVLNPNVTYHNDGSDTYDYQKVRFVSGASFCSENQKEGHAYGHLIRVVDATNSAGKEWLRVDLFYVCIELVAAGWAPRILHRALLRVLHECPSLADIVSAVSLCLQRLNSQQR